jgi:hypothetical protein
MPRQFTSADVVQHNSEATGATAVTDPGVGLSNPAIEGNGGFAVVFAANILSAAEQWHMVAQSPDPNPSLGIFCRADLPPSDQSWVFSAFNITTYWTWLAEEWTNLSYAPLLAYSSTAASVTPASKSTGTTGTWDAPYALGIAAVGIWNSAATGGSTWPTWSAWSNGFTETDVLSHGTGTAQGDLELHVARCYGALNDTGGWESTVTFTGSMTGKNVYGCLAVFRAESLLGDI